MPFSYSIESDASPGGRTLVLVHATPDVDAADASELFTSLSLEDAVGPGSVMLVDASSGNGPPNPRRVHEMVQGLWTLKQKGLERIAVIAPHPSTFGSTELAGVLAKGEGVTIRAFRDAASARSWLKTG
jgi:hypothetical protein